MNLASNVCLECGGKTMFNQSWCPAHSFLGRRLVTVVATPKPPGEVLIQELRVRMSVEYVDNPILEAADLLCCKDGVLFEDYDWRVTL